MYRYFVRFCKEVFLYKVHVYFYKSKMAFMALDFESNKPRMKAELKSN